MTDDQAPRTPGAQADWQHSMLARLQQPPQQRPNTNDDDTSERDTSEHDTSEHDDLANRTVLRPAPRPAESRPDASRPVTPARRPSGPASHATPTRAEGSYRTNLTPRDRPAMAKAPISAVPTPAQAATARATPAPSRTQTSLVTGPGPDVHAELERRGRARGESLAARVGKSAARLLGRDNFPERYQAAVAAIQAPVTTGRRVAVVSVDGGVGRSTVTACLGLVFASLRRDVTAVVSLATAPSPLGLRLGADSVVSTSQVANTADETGDPMRFLLRFTRVAPSLVCCGASTGDQPVGPDQQAALSRGLSGAAAMTLFDCAAGLDVRATRQAVAESHAVLAVGTASIIGVDHLRQLLDQVAGSRPVVVALVSADGRQSQGAEAAIRRLERPGASIHRIGWDAHLAAGGHLHLDHLAERTRLELAALASEVLAQARKAG